MVIANSVQSGAINCVPTVGAQLIAPASLLNQLTLTSRLDNQGFLVLNYPVIDRLVAWGSQTIQPLVQFFQASHPPLVLAHGLYVAQRLAEQNTPGIQRLVDVTNLLQYHPHPLVQIYLAGFYRYVHGPDTFGPLLGMAIRDSLLPPVNPPAWNPLPEIGGTLLQQLAERTRSVTGQ